MNTPDTTSKSPEGHASVASILPEVGSDPVAAVRNGLPYSALERMRQRLGVSDKLLAQALAVSTRTLSRRRQQGRLASAESDRLVLLAEVFALATQAFDSDEAARQWLHRPHALLGSESPLDRMDTVTGMEEVKTILYHIEYTMPV